MTSSTHIEIPISQCYAYYFDCQTLRNSREEIYCISLTFLVSDEKCAVIWIIFPL